MKLIPILTICLMSLFSNVFAEEITLSGLPLMYTEYLARGHGSTFETHLPYFKENKIGAWNWGLVAGKTQTQYPWSSSRKKFTAEPDVWHHDILRPDGAPFKASEVELIRSLMGKK